jgi:hypothetical protein
MNHFNTLNTMGRAVAYYPKLGNYLKSPLAGIFLCQLMYWHDKAESSLGVYKTAEQWKEETGMTYSQQKTARDLLKSLGLIIETEKRLEHKIFFKLNIDRFNEWFSEICHENTEVKESSSRIKNIEFGEEEYRVRRTRNPKSVIHKNTHKITTLDDSNKNTKKKKFSFRDELLKLGADQQLVDDFCLVREKKKAVDSLTAFNKFIGQQSKSGMNLNAVLELCIEKSWKGFEVSWLKNQNSLSFNNNQQRGFIDFTQYRDI